jgi:GNAT superfamily N-acetyltransferase
VAAARIRPLTIGDAAAAASLIREAFAAQSRATDPPSSALPAWRGQGIARALLAAGEAEARRRGLKRMTLRVRLALGENQRLFAGFGFAPAGQGAHPGYRQPTFLLMEKRLA